jgi:hypothetical protein
MHLVYAGIVRSRVSGFQVADYNNNVLRRIAGGVVTTLTGSFFDRGSLI